MVTFKKGSFLAFLIFVLLFAPLFQVEAEQMFIQPLPDGPSERWKHTAIYDSEHNEIIFFGGKGSAGCLNDVWKLSLSSLSWSEVTTIGDIPEVRQSHNAIYDPLNQRMLVFGGTNPEYVFNDLYSLDLNTYSWTQLSPAGTLPSPRWNSTAIYNPTDSSMYIFGGRQLYPIFKKTGELDTAIYNPINNNKLLYFGQEAGTWFDDLWKLNLNTLTWTEITPVDEIPPARECHTATYISSGNYMLVYAGYAEWDCYDDLWKYDFATNIWSQVLPSGYIPLPKSSHSAFYDDLNNRLITFGGIEETWITFDDIWELDLSSFTWNKLFPLLSRSGQAGMYDPQRQGMIIFGGYTFPSDYIFGDGYVVTLEEDLPFSYGDANCDGDITILDVVYTINYLFKGGPPPCSPSGR